MRNTVAVMNTKGGVGKSTLVLAVAETLSAVFRKNVLIIDSDSQASVSAMLLSASNLHRLQSEFTKLTAEIDKTSDGLRKEMTVKVSALVASAFRK